MKMLKLNILLLGVLALGIYSCSDDFLNVEPETSIFDSNFYQTQDDAEKALIGCYDGWQRTSSNGNFAFYLASEVMSDECFGGTGNADGRGYQVVDRFNKSESPSDANLFNGLWADYYAGIFRCNKLLMEIDNITWDGETAEQDSIVKNRIEGETKAIRALLYFDLIRLFGNIPLLTEPSEENLPQVDPVDVYELIAQDLIFAANNIPQDAYPKSNASSNDGRITPYAAKALLARVFLYYTGYYDESDLAGVVSKNEVLAGLEDIISSGEFDLVPEFKNLWEASSTWTEETENNGELVKQMKSTYAGRGNIETVLAQKFNTTQDYDGNMDGNRWLVMMGMRNTNFVPYGKGWGGCTVHPKMWDVFEAGDNRKTASIIDIAGEGIAEDFDLKDQREYTGYTVKKYTPLSKWQKNEETGQWEVVSGVTGLGEGDFQISQYQDYIVMRYADVLLMAAELGSANADVYLNKVRKRAYSSTDEEGNLIVSDNFQEITATQQNILDERMLEFAFEGLRYWDLMRQGVETAASVIANESGVSVLSGGANDQVVIEATDIIEKKGLSQIPATQITLSDNKLEQNKGW